MKEKIYTIPVTEAFSEDCECPMCVLEKKLEDECVDYVLGPSLMEPDGRIETNEKGFCRHHFEQLYNKQVNRLGLGLILETHIQTQNREIAAIFDSKAAILKKEAQTSFIKGISNKLTLKQTDTNKIIDELICKLDNLESKCTICGKMNFTMDRYIDVILYLWFEEEDFRNLFNSKKGFCLKHLKQLLHGTKKYLGQKEAAIFLQFIMKQQLENMTRINEEISWFNKKFDYRYTDAPWGASKDAVQRSLQKITGYCDLE